MPTRDRAPLGAPCWADLWTSDVEGSRRFYSELFGWEAGEPSPEFGGYFMFLREGVPVAGGMGPMADAPADDTWKVYLASQDTAKTLEQAEAAGAAVVMGTMPIADLGVQGLLVDPTGAPVGVWQPGTFPGFAATGEQGAPSWFELSTRDDARALAFYRLVFGWEPVEEIAGEMRYTTLRGPEGGEELAGIMDASGFLPEGAPSRWSIYWEVDDPEALMARARSLGGRVLRGVDDTPYGRLAALADPAGAQFKIRSRPAS